MSHISGHWEGKATVGAAANPNQLGVISLEHRRECKVLCFNNLGVLDPPADNKIGFHMHLIRLKTETSNGKKYYAIAYDPIPLEEHQNLDAKARAAFNQNLEDLIDDPNDDDETRERKRQWYNNLSPKEKDVHDQTRNYKKTQSFQILYRQGVPGDDQGRQEWISRNVLSLTDISPI